MELPKFETPIRQLIIHMAIGGVASLFLTILLYPTLQNAIEGLLINSGSVGIVIFEEFRNAFQIISFGVVYLPSGFIGGLYTGYKIKEKPRIVLGLLGVIDFVLFVVLGFFTGTLDPTSVDLLIDILIPLSGIIIGSYLGGYTINWPSGEEESLEEEETIDEEEEKEEEEKIKLNSKKKTRKK